MSQFVRVTKPDGEPLWVNVGKIRTLRISKLMNSHRDWVSHTVISFSDMPDDESDWHVTETPETILRQAEQS